MSLDTYQRAAVDSNAKSIQLIGFPGTGKTLVLANRIARLIEDGVSPESIITLTYTNSSCSALRETISRKLDPSLAALAEHVQIKTYHTFCRDLIKQHPEELGLTRDWEIIDPVDIQNLGHYPRSGRKSRSSLNNTNSNEDNRKTILHNLKTYDFEEALQFGEMLVKTHNFGISHLIIDEFQDCSRAQWRLVKAIVAAHPDVNLVVAGDPHQEIFNFEEEHLDNPMTTMIKTFPDTEILYLRYNYRSTSKIIETFEHIVKPLEDYNPRSKLIPTILGGKEPILTEYENQEDLLEGITSLINSLRGQNYSYQDISILVRTNAELQRIASYMEQNGIPMKHELGMRFYASERMTSMAVTLMKWCRTPKDFYLLQLINNRFYRLFTDRELQLLLSNYGKDNNQSLMDVIRATNPKKSQHPLLTSFLPNYRQKLLGCATPTEVASILQQAASSWPTLMNTPSPLRSYNIKIEKLAWKEMMDQVNQCTNDNAMEKLPLEERAQPGAALSVVLKTLFNRELPYSSNHVTGVTLSTIHSAKSNEWPVIILPSSVQNRFFPVSASQIKSERRLHYVATSRACKEIYFVNEGPVRWGTRNSFLKLSNTTEAPNLVGVAEAKMRYPEVFKPLKAIRRLCRTIRY